MLPVRLVRFAKLAVLIADVSTMFCAFLLVGWQITIFLRDGSWRVLPLSLVFSRDDQGEIYSTIFTNAFLQLPIIMALFLAAATLTVFYLWISHLEKELTKTQIQ